MPCAEHMRNKSIVFFLFFECDTRFQFHYYTSRLTENAKKRANVAKLWNLADSDQWLSRIEYEKENTAKSSKRIWKFRKKDAFGISRLRNSLQKCAFGDILQIQFPVIFGYFQTRRIHKTGKEFLISLAYSNTWHWKLFHNISMWISSFIITLSLWCAVKN